MSDPRDPGHPLGPEVDDSQNPTTVAPEGEPAGATTAGEGPRPDSGSEQAYGSWQAGDERGGERQQPDMLLQLQQMIDSLAAQAGPVMRDVAAKAAELAAIAAERTGPIAHRAADATERVSGRVAERSKEMAAELRRRQAEERAAEAAGEGAFATEPGAEEKREADA